MKSKNLHFFIVLTLYALSISSYGWAQKTVSTAQAQKVAEIFALDRNNKRAVRSVPTLKLVYTATKNGRLKAGVNDTSTANVYYHVFNAGNNEGFVIVAGNDVAKPILGYSDKGNFSDNYDSLPVGLQDLLSQYRGMIQWAIDHKVKPGAATQKRWQHYHSDTTVALLSRGTRTRVLPLAYTPQKAAFGPSVAELSAPPPVVIGGYTPGNILLDSDLAWNQWFPFNAYFPSGPTLGNSYSLPYYGGLAYTGCVATAISQIFYYWYQKNYPAVVVKEIPPSPDIIVNGNTIANSFNGNPVFPDIAQGSTFDWSNMLTSYDKIDKPQNLTAQTNPNTLNAQDKAVALLMQAVGAAIANEQFNTSASYNPATGITTYLPPLSSSYIQFNSTGTSVTFDFWPPPHYQSQLPNQYISHFGGSNFQFVASNLQYPLSPSSSDIGNYEDTLMGWVDNGWPVLYGIQGYNDADESSWGGHAVVCDGYEFPAATADTMFHFNFGWSNVGNTNAWYTINPINFMDGGDGVNVPLISSGNTPNQYAFAIYPTGEPAALPVQLLGFTAQAQTNNTVLLQWSTATELNNRGFTIQRSADGIHWSSLTFINSLAKNNSSSVQLNYSYIDMQPLNGLNHYRLAQTDLDGTITYSTIQSVQFNGLSTVSVYPNPVQSQLTIAVPDNATYNLLNGNGVMVLQGVLQAGKTTISVRGLADGIYFLRVTTVNGVISTHKIDIIK